jgi:YD repeat-containing protein
VQRQRGRDNRTKAAIRSPPSGVGSTLGPRTGMLLVTWAVGTPITYSSSSLTIRGPDRIGHQARSSHRDGRNGGYSSRRRPENGVIRVNHPQTESRKYSYDEYRRISRALFRGSRPRRPRLAPVIWNATFSLLDTPGVQSRYSPSSIASIHLKSRGWCSQVP